MYYDESRLAKKMSMFFQTCIPYLSFYLFHYKKKNEKSASSKSPMRDSVTSIGSLWWHPQGLLLFHRGALPYHCILLLDDPPVTWKLGEGMQHDATFKGLRPPGIAQVLYRMETWKLDINSMI